MAVTTFDAGLAGAPGGVDGDVDRVIVVGAGIAGLTVANALNHAGVECVTLEARDRVGGRLHTVEVAGVPVDLGGSWIHHPIGNPLTSFADVAGVERGAGDPLPSIAAFDFVEERRLSADELERLLGLQLEAFPHALDRLRTTLGSRANAADAVEAFLADAALDPSGVRRARQALRAVLEADAADHAERQSLQWLWHEVEYGGDLFGDLPMPGYQSVVAAMAARLDVRLRTEARRIDTSGGRALVTTSAGEVFEGSHVVVSVPLGVLKDARLRFDPALPPERAAAIDRLGFGRYEKIVVAFDDAFWRDAGLSHLILFPHEPAQAAVWVFDLDAFGAGPALAFHLFASNTPHALDASDDAAAAWAVAAMEMVLGHRCPQPRGVAVTRWAADPLAGGAYAHVTPEAEPADLDLLGEPIGGRLLFAGEHTQSARTGYADGAMASGVREAMRLLRLPQVELGPLSG
jgi:monoamine oxidase